ncbi:MAG: HAD family hydrolase [Halobacteriaceae archaeon]
MPTREEYDAVVYDLDGTLVRLRVDWDAVAADLRNMLVDAGHDAEGDAWDCLAAAESVGLYDAAHERIAAHEHEGARDSVRLAVADELPTLNTAVGVCSLNAERAVRAALDRHDLTQYVDSVVARGTIPERKPRPEPLLRAVRELGAVPSNALFVGDSASDEETARRAGTDFAYVGDGPTDVGR